MARFILWHWLHCQCHICEGLVEWPLSEAPQEDCHKRRLMLTSLLLPWLIFYLKGVPSGAVCHRGALGEGGPCLLIIDWFWASLGTSRIHSRQPVDHRSTLLSLLCDKHVDSLFRLVLLVYWHTGLYLGWSGLWSWVNGGFRKKQNANSFIKPFLDLHLSYRNL